MKIGIPAKIVGALQLLVALFYLDLKSWNQILVSVLLFLGGLLMLMLEGEAPAIQRTRAILSYLIFPIAIALIIKLLFLG